MNTCIYYIFTDFREIGFIGSKFLDGKSFLRRCALSKFKNALASHSCFINADTSITEYLVFLTYAAELCKVTFAPWLPFNHAESPVYVRGAGPVSHLYLHCFQNQPGIIFYATLAQYHFYVDQDPVGFETGSDLFDYKFCVILQIYPGPILYRSHTYFIKQAEKCF
jgi:hypothetical protein